MSVPITITKADAIKELKAKRRSAVEFDKAAKRRHPNAERAALAAYRADLRRHLAMSYEELKALKYREHPQFDAPSCPTLATPAYDKALEMLAKDSRPDDTKLTLKSGDSLYLLLARTFGSDPRTVCD